MNIYQKENDEVGEHHKVQTCGKVFAAIPHLQSQIHKNGTIQNFPQLPIWGESQKHIDQNTIAENENQLWRPYIQKKIVERGLNDVLI